jgi:hypothetical protein
MIRLLYYSQKKAFFQFCVFLILTALLGGCQDTCERMYTYTLYEPIYMSFDELRAAVKTEAPQDIQQAGKIYIIGKYLLVNEPNKGIHVFDNSDPVAPKNLSFINIPGNIDMAVKGNILYADSHIDLVAFDISNPATITEVGRVENIFPTWTRTFASAQQIDPAKGIIVDFKESRTTQISGCEETNMQPYFWHEGMFAISNRADFAASPASAMPSSSSKPGIGGSMARYTIYDNFLYTIDDANMQLFDISSPANPAFSGLINVGFNIETIYPYKDKLFIGSQTGMHIYDNADPANPVRMSTFAHVRSCDPVVADDKYAYVTLRNGNTCGGFANQLDVIDITNLSSPRLVKSYQMSNPHGLGLDYDTNTLFVCDGTSGLKVYDANYPLTLDKNILSRKTGHTYDVIPYKNIAIVTGNDGISQYDYTDPNNLKLLSKISVVKAE